MQYKEGNQDTLKEEPMNTVGGWTRPLLGITGSVVLAELLVIGHRPGMGLGLYGLCLLVVLAASRKRFELSKWHWATAGILGLSALQAARFTSLSNVVVMWSLLLILSGESVHRSLSIPWVRWFEGLLSIFRPLGSLLAFQKLQSGDLLYEHGYRARLKHVLLVIVPPLAFLLVFGMLLSGGNAILGKWSISLMEMIDLYLSYIELPSFERLVIWGFFGGIAFILVCPAVASRYSKVLPSPWAQLGSQPGRLRAQQWIAVLTAMNALFLLSTMTDVVYLWLSHELPEGVSHSQYLHKGVYALILTTLLSAFIMGTLTQHSDKVRKNLWIRGLALAWMVQNLILISGVFIRLWIYVDAYGYTPKRIYVSLFLCVVLIGYAFLAWAVSQFKDFKWLVGSNLVLLFIYFSILQLVDVPRIVVGLNTDLYVKGEITYPECLHLRQIGSHAVPYLIEIYNNPQSEEHRQKALTELRCGLYPLVEYRRHSWQSFAYRDYRNSVILEEFLDSIGEELQ